MRRRGERASADAGAQAVQGAGAVAFEREQVFASPEDAFDALADRCQVRAAAEFVFAARSDDGHAELRACLFEVAADVALVADHVSWPVRQSGSIARQTSRSFALGVVSASARGVPSSANRPCSRKPQKRRLWRRCSRNRRRRRAGCAGRLDQRPHSTGVESTRTRSSWKPGLSWAKTAISRSIASESRSRRL